MKSFYYSLFFLSTFLIACSEPANESDIAKWKLEIEKVEKDFNAMAQKEGLTQAFRYFAAEDGVIRRGKKVIKGKEAIKEWYKKDVRPNETLTWKPSFVDISKSGDMAYTYGNYIFTSTDSTGTKKESTGIFHTVWKRQTDGSWKFVWD